MLIDKKKTKKLGICLMVVVKRQKNWVIVSSGGVNDANKKDKKIGYLWHDSSISDADR